MYLDWFIRRSPRGVMEPTESGAEHFFVILLTAALLGADSPSATAREARELLELLGVGSD